MHQRYTRERAFTLAELLIALAILGVIATFTIPKVLQAQQDSRYNAIAKETASMIAGAYQSARLAGKVTTGTRPEDLLPYMNYVAVTTADIDAFYTDTTRSCTTYYCVTLHNGATLLFGGNSFAGTASTNAITFLLDPDGKITDSTTNGPGKSLQLFIYYSSRMTTYAHVDGGTVDSTGWPAGPATQADPPWFHWN